MTKAKEAFDVRSAEPILFYVGPGIVGDVPAADLSAHSLARVARIRGRDQSAIAAIRDELIASGHYATKPSEEPEDE